MITTNIRNSKKKSKSARYLIEYIIYAKRGEMLQYRNFPSGDERYPILGFGCMRFPTLTEGSGIDRQRAEEMLDYALEKGVNYFDTAWPYHDGESEPFLGRFLEERKARNRVNIATKLPSWLIRRKEDPMSFFLQQLERLRTDHVDHYLLHSLNSHTWNHLIKVGIFDFLDEIQGRGHAKMVGFSFHDEYSLFREILESYPWDFCQIQYNFLDTDYQAGLRGLKLAASKKIGVVVSEPLRGGCITRQVPPEIMAIWNEGAAYSPAEWALRYVWDDSRIQVVLSGMRTLEEVEENIRIASEVRTGSLGEEDFERYIRVSRFYEQRQKALCSGCRYCMPCTQGVAIPEVLHFLNEACMFRNPEGTADLYHRTIREKKGAQLCISCKVCERSCPQHLPIADLMQEAVEVLG